MAAALGVAVMVGTAAGATAPPFPALPPYVFESGATLMVRSNSQWIDVGTGRPVRQTRKASVGTTRSKDPPFYVWAQTCKTGRQSLRVRRNVWLAGPPARLALFLTDPGLVPRSEVEVRLNGKLALRASGEKATWNVIKLDAQARYLVTGTNTIELLIVKSKGRPGSCTSFLGYAFDLHGAFTADLAVGKGGGTEYVKGYATLQIALGNKGPSLVPQVRFLFSMDTRPDILGAIPMIHILGRKTQGDISNCAEERFASAPEEYFIACVWNNFAPGDTGTFEIEIGAVSSKPYPEETLSMRWYLNTTLSKGEDAGTGPTDPNLDNNSSKETWVFCGPTATEPKCR